MIPNTTTKLPTSRSTESSTDSVNSDTNDATQQTDAGQPRGGYLVGLPENRPPQFTVFGEGFRFTYEDPVDTLKSESKSEGEGGGVTDVNNTTVVQNLVGLIALKSEQAQVQECRNKIYIAMFVTAVAVTAITTGLLLYRSFRPVSTGQPDVNPDFESSAFNTFTSCARELGLDLTTADEQLITELVGSLKASYGNKLASIDVGALLKCRPDQIEKSVGGIFQDFAEQLDAAAAAATAAAGFSSSSACLIVLSLVFLLAYGVT